MGLVVLAACGKEGEQAVVDEHDGAEITALMQNAHEAVKNDNVSAFDSLFFSAQKARKIWERINKAKEWRGMYRVIEFTEAPVIERAVPTIHVDKLALQAWFYFPQADKRHDKLFSTKWTFVKIEDKWGLEDIYFNHGLSQYGDIMNDLRQMSRLSFQAMAMDWEKGIDPTPVLDRMYQALAEGNIEALKACTIDGTMFRAGSQNVAMPRIATGNTAGGKYNRKISQDSWEHNINNIKNFSSNMGVTPEFLRPYFGAYRIASMPSKCTKVLMRMEYSGKGIPELTGKIGRFRLSWAAARMYQRWLAESMYIESIEGYQ
jgi:hypothetical protein